MMLRDIRNKMAWAVIILLMTLSAQQMRAQQLAVNTDVLWDAAMTPNLGIEMTTGDRSTLGVSVMAADGIWGQSLKGILVQPEYRYFISGRAMYHHFIGIGALAASYDVSLRNRHYNGYGAGLGVTFGYVLPLSRRLNLDFHAGLGAFLYQQKEHLVDKAYSDDNGINAHGYYVMPTRIGISLTYILK